MVIKIEPFYVDVGHRIRDGRNKLGMTQEQLGQLLSPPTTRVSIANIEAGKQRILSHTLVQIATALKMKVTSILPPDNKTGAVPNLHDIANELVSKLGISKNKADKFLAKAKTTKN